MASEPTLTVRQTEVLLAYKRAAAVGRTPKQRRIAIDLGVSYARVGQIVSVLIGKGFLIRDGKTVRLP